MPDPLDLIGCAKPKTMADQISHSTAGEKEPPSFVWLGEDEDRYWFSGRVGKPTPKVLAPVREPKRAERA
jgi:hypothetical protein